MEGLSSRTLLHTGLQIVGVVTIIKGIVNLIAICGTILANQEMMVLGLHVSAALAPVLMVSGSSNARLTSSLTPIN